MKTSAASLLAFLFVLCACEEEKKPTQINVKYTVNFRGAHTEVTFSGDLDDTVSGYCYLRKTGDGSKDMTLRLLRRAGSDNTHELEILSLMVPRSAPASRLSCEGVHVNYNNVEERNTLPCGELAESSCEFNLVVNDDNGKRIEGTFECGEFPTTSIDPSGPVPMSISNGTFSITNCH
jgi:hypothetical protein